MLAQGCKVLGATLVALVVIWTGAASAQQPIEPLGGQLRLTQQGVDGAQDVDAVAPDVAYNSQRNEFLVVWENSLAGGDVEIFGRRLGPDGAPLAPAFQISGVAADPANFDSREPAVAYDFERDRYAVVFSRDDSLSEREIFGQIVSGSGELVPLDPTEPPGADPFTISSVGDNTTTFQASSPDIAYRADVDGGGPNDSWVIVYGGDELDEQFNIFANRIPAAPTGFFLFFTDTVSVMGAAGDGFEPSVTIVPGGEDHVVAWEGATAGTDTEIFVRRMAAGGGASPPQVVVTANAEDINAADPSITANADDAELLIAYRSGENPAEGSEIAVQRLDVGLGPRGTNDQQVSSAGPPGSGGSFFAFAPSAAYHSGLKRYLVTWIGSDVDRPGLSNDEREVQGTTLDSSGAEGQPQDFTISRMGADNDEDATPLTAAPAVNGQTGRWLSVWSSDDARPPLADGEFEVWGRQVGENFDRDADGANVPTDCDDANPGIRPGANDVFDNGIDEDCAGGDAQNPDRDGDGATRPGDCNDGNPAIRPGAVDVPNNEIDEDCAGGPRRTLVDVGVERFFAVFRTHTKVTRLRVTKLRPGMRIELRCKGKGCPKPLRKKKVRRVKVEQRGSRNFTKLFRKAKLKPKAEIEVRVYQPGAIARVDEFLIRDAKLPTRKQRCIPPGASKPRKCGA